MPQTLNDHVAHWKTALGGADVAAGTSSPAPAPPAAPPAATPKASGSHVTVLSYDQRDLLRPHGANYGKDINLPATHPEFRENALTPKGKS